MLGSKTVRTVTLAFLMVVVPACASGVSTRQIPLPGGSPGGASAHAAPQETSANAAGASAQGTPEQIRHAVRQSLYLVSTPAGNSTGFCLRNGRIATSLHALLGHSTIWVTDVRGQKRRVESVRAFDSDHDLAILDAGAGLSPGLELAQPEIPTVGAPLVVLGNPQSAPNPVSNGTLGSVRTVSPALTLLQIDAPLPPGSSGAPVLNSQGQVVGVIAGAFATAQDPKLAIPVRYLRDSLARLKQWITMSTFAAITAPALPQPRWLSPASGQKQNAFPISVAGFAFGMSIPDAEHACKGKLTGDQNFATCSFKPVDVPFANNNVSIRFESGRLIRVYLRGASWDDVTRAMLTKYGKPGLVEVRNGGSWDPSSDWKKGSASRATWWLDGGTLVVFSQDGRDLALIYAMLP
jgi:S1-C subfamily serine protease